LAHEALQKGNLDIHRTEIGGDSVDLGGFKQYVFKGETNRQVEWGIELDTSKFEKRMKEIFSPVKRLTLEITIGLAHKEETWMNIEELTLQKFETLRDVQFSDFMAALKKGKEEKETEADDSEIEKYRYRDLTIKEFLDMQKEPRVMTYKIEADGIPIITMSIRKGGFLRLDTVNNDHAVFKSIIEAIITSTTTTDKVTSEDYAFLNSAIFELTSKIAIESPKFLPQGLKEIVRESKELLTVSKGRRHDDLLAALNIFFPRLIDEIIRGLREIVEDQIKLFRYLGPLRSYPPRHLAFAQYHDQNWQAGGGFAWEEVRNRPELRKKINEWLGDSNKLNTPYELIVQHLLTIDDLEKHYSKRVSAIENAFVNSDEEDESVYSGDLFGDIYYILKDLKKIEPNITNIRELILKDKRTETIVSHRDVGIGISQVLPVLVSAYGNKGSIIAIEQPEIHLHPALQAELGDVFIEAALGERKNTLIIETHSEHLLLRIMRRVRETTSGKLPKGIVPVHPEDVMVLFVEPDGSRSVIHEMPINEKGDLVNLWPGGFFEEGFKELF
jgi:Uncharacterized conserved protein